MKKILKSKVTIIIGSILLIALITVGIYLYCNRDSKYIAELTLDEYYTLLEEEGTHLVIFASPTCKASESFKPKMKKVLKENDLVISYYDTSKLVYNSDDYNKVWNSANATGTPTVFIIKDGELVDNLMGNVSENKFKQFLKTNEIIK